jgi:hypothetical protein
MDQEQLAEIVKEIEEEQALNRTSAVQVFRSALNQPELISLSSANATANGASYAYSQFDVNMPRPIYEADTLQLLTANIPLCTQNIPDTACVFWYYRLDLYANTVPNTENLFFVRLLPSYYKPEFFQPTPSKYGQNITFDNYPAVATQLALSCKNDLLRDNINLTINEWSGSSVPQLQYIPQDVTITYDATQNKFQLTGLNAGAPLFSYEDAPTYANLTVYDAGDYVTYNDDCVYRCLLDGTQGIPPYTVSSLVKTWAAEWTYVTNRVVQTFVSYTPYYNGQYVSSGGVIYQASATGAAGIWTGSFSAGDGWVTPTQPLGPYNYRYLATGYGDPNVVINQGTNVVGGNGRQWNPYSLFETSEIVQYQGITYQSSKQTKGFVPFYVPTQSANTYDQYKTYYKGDYVYYNFKWYVNIWVPTKPGQVNYTVGLDKAPTGLYTANTWWKFIEFDPNVTTQYWRVGDLMTYLPGVGNGVFWFKCIKDNNVSQGSPFSTGGIFNTNPYWIPSYWTPLTSSANLPTIGLYSLSRTFDMLDAFSGYEQYPFPIAIPPQPYNPNPRRLLNSILGFCWNGIFNATILNTSLGASTGIPNGTTTSDVLNRVRPVPYYTSYGSGSGLRTGNSTTAMVFTADGYANLVYTSVVSIYSTIVFGSTLDTQRNTNLIGLASMNAGNLGVSFFANFIDGKLRVNGGDIYAIGIELRDEMGELYPLTNNGISSFTLKLTYKDVASKNKA